MSDLVSGLGEAWRLLAGNDAEVWSIILLSLRVSLVATCVALLLGTPLGAVLALTRFPGHALAVGGVYAGMGLPPIVAGLIVSVMLWRNGPFGAFGLLYSPVAMIIAQALIATPVVAALTFSAIHALDPRYRLQLTALGANRVQTAWWLLREARLPLIAAVVAGFGAVISEVGAAMMVGGNIKGETRVLTTATVLEVSRGHFDVAFALSFVLLAITYLVTFLLGLLQRQPQPARR
ncbi:MAG: ABC transporter permease [Thermomicrobiales bacterium]|nr:ABC transporter permease [Thermomicrobiales bacterium]